MLGPRFCPCQTLENFVYWTYYKIERMVHVSKQKQSTGSGCGVLVLLLVVLVVIAIIAGVLDIPFWVAVLIILAIPCVIWLIKVIIQHRKKAVADAATAEAAAKAEEERIRLYQAAQEAEAQRREAIATAAAEAAAGREKRYEAARQAEAQRKEREEQRFRDALDGLDLAKVTIDRTADLQPLSLSDMPEIRYANIPASFNRDTLPAFVVIDTETTGLSANRDGIIELSAIRFEEFRPVAGWTTLIDPGQRIPAEASAVNNITDAMVSEAPTIAQVAQSFADFCGTAPIVGYNLPFDLKFLYASGIDLNVKRRKYYDVLAIARKYFKGDLSLSSYKLGYVATQCGLVPVDAHRSLSDCLTTGLLLDRLISIM